MSTVGGNDLDFLSNPNKLNEILESVKKGQANWTPPAPKTAASAAAKPLFGHWQDWISLTILVLVLVDYLRMQVKWLRYEHWFPTKTAAAARVPETEDENKPLTSNKGLRRRKNARKGKKENKPRVEDDDDKLLKELELTREARRGGPSDINMYDLAKILAVLTCIIDHYGYFGIPGISYVAARWTRVIGRMSAPLFFFLTGYSNKFRFRWHSWCWAVMLFVVNAWLGFRLTATAWDSMNTILTINWLFSYIKWEKHLAHWSGYLFHGVLIAVGLYFESYVNDEIRMAYGTLPYMFAIGAQLVKKKYLMGKVWILCTSIHYAYGSASVFGQTHHRYCAIWAVVTINCLMFMFFDRLTAMGSFKFFNKTGLLKKAMLYVSRQAIIVYIVHLFIFRTIQLTKWNW